MLKKGDVITIMTEKEILRIYDGLLDVPYGVVEQMEKCLGCEYTVTSSTHKGECIKLNIDIEGRSYSWHSSILKKSNDVTNKVFDVLRG